MSVEFVPGSSAADDPEDELGSPPPRMPRWVPVGIAAGLVAAAIAIVAQRSADPTPQAAPAPSASASQPYPFPSSTPVPDQISTLDPTLFGVYNTALDSAPAQTIVRNGSTTGVCPLVKIGTSPQTSIARTLVRMLKGFGRVDTAVIIDRDAGLCSVQVRARDRHGIVSVLRVTAPSGGSGGSESVTGGDGTISGSRVEYAEYRSERGWHVVAGAAGPVGGRDRLPLRSALQTLAMDTSLRW